MKLINVTNRYSELVQEQLAHTDAFLAEVYALGKTTVVLTHAKTHRNLMITPKDKELKESELHFLVKHLLKTSPDNPHIDYLYGPNFIEVALNI